MNISLLKYLICPFSNSELNLYEIEFNKDNQKEIEIGILQSKSREEILYPIINGIPRMLPDSLYKFYYEINKYLSKLPNSIVNIIKNETSFSSRKLEKEFKHTQKSFSAEWKKIKDYDRPWGRDIKTRHNEFIARLDIQGSDITGKKILDAGSGHGEIVFSLMDRESEIFAMDISFSVDIIRRKLKQLNRSHRASVHIIQANVHSLPFINEMFDYIFCDGVLHHTPDTLVGFKNLTKALRPCGKCFIMVYSSDHKQWIHKFVNFIVDKTRPIRTRLPHGLLFIICRLLAPAHWLFVNGYNFIRKNKKYRRRNLRETSLSLFDAFSPLYDWHHSTDEVIGWYKSLNYDNIKRTFYNHVGIGIVGRLKSK